MYDSDVTEAGWELIQAFCEQRDKRGAVPKHDKWAIVNAIFTSTRRVAIGGCYRMISRLGRLSLTTGAVGTNGVFGKACWMP